MIQNYTLVRCPKCGYEYTLAEIFFPDDLLGNPINITRDNSGHIEFIEGKMPELTETYDCVNCGITFKTRLMMTTSSSYNKLLDEEDFTIDLTDSDKKKLF